MGKKKSCLLEIEASALVPMPMEGIGMVRCNFYDEDAPPREIILYCGLTRIGASEEIKKEGEASRQ